MALYSPLNGESLYDIAAKLYKDASVGIGDIITLNPELDLNADSYFGTSIVYSDKSTIKNPTASTLISKSDPPYLTRNLQTVYDLAVQLYGDVSKIGILLNLFPNLNTGIILSSSITVDPQSDPIALYFKANNLIVATDIPVEATVGNFRITNLGFRIINTGDFRIVNP